MFKAQQTKINDRVHHYQLWQQKRQLSVDEVLYLWESNEPFNVFFTQLLTESPFSAYRWETPAVTFETGDRPFEFVLVDSPGLDRQVDSRTFQGYFTPDGQGIVTFNSLGGDALLVVPSPRGEQSAYGHLAAFIRHAPTEQALALWQAVGRAVATQMSERPLWLNTAGGGVAWLHVRLDSRPKYYRYAPYKSFKG
ncbi:MAG: hypothetical protein F6J87_30535 [Spirulina sp. SIO3F2]|nr:hypothetical protein [Spirulina sp. SIO3F2]